MKLPKIVLASRSPRRRDILKQIGLRFEAFAVDVDESTVNGSSPEKSAIEISRLKAHTAAEKHPDSVIIAADTIVVLKNGEVLGKPKDESDVKRMLSKLAGDTHVVITAVTLLNGRNKEVVSLFDRSEVTFSRMTGAQVEWYVATKEPMDKAGGYGLQEKGMLFVSSVNGSAATVIGLPVHLLYQMFKEARLNLMDYIDS